MIYFGAGAIQADGLDVGAVKGTEATMWGRSLRRKDEERNRAGGGGVLLGLDGRGHGGRKESSSCPDP